MHFKKRGFAIAEVVVALFLVGMVAALVGGLGQQVMNFAKRSAQTSAILEIRGMASTITREPGTWLNKMRSASVSSGLYAGCIPDMSATVSTFQCPGAMSTAELQSYDAELAEIAGGQYFALSAPIIDYNGNTIAGTSDAPVYLNNEGRVCNNSNENSCAFKSIGFFLRSNQATDADPGNIKFVIKIAKNFTATNASTAPMKNQYISMEIGDTWKKVDVFSGDTCPSGTIKLGYLITGEPRCVNITDPCQSNQFLIGINSSGDSICKTIPNCEPTEHISLNSDGSDLVCVSQQTPCGANNIFLGYFAGSGEPICQGANISCSSGEVQIGVNIEPTGNITAQCTAAPPTSCPEANQRVAFNGVAFSCQSAGAQKSCPSGKVMSGIDSAGEVMCVEERSTASVSGDCPDLSDGRKQYLKGINARGELNCQPLPSGGSGVSAQEMCSTLSGTWDSSTNKCAVTNTTNTTNVTNNTYNAVITPWTNAGASILSSSRPTETIDKGNAVVDVVSWQRIGNVMHLTWRLQITSGGGTNKGHTLFEIPGGYEIDTSKLPVPNSVTSDLSAPVGRLMRLYRAQNGNCTGVVYAYNTKKLQMHALCNAHGAPGSMASGWFGPYVTMGGTGALYVEAKFPIAGWQ